MNHKDFAVETPPSIEAALSTIAMPGDANPAGDIFGGWLLSQMDLAGSIPACERAKGRVATIAIEAMKFHRAVLVGDRVRCYAEVQRVGRTSMNVKIETWVSRLGVPGMLKVTEGVFTYVAIDGNRHPRPVDL
ncbi:MAG: acyl-CoA thioesterase [Rhodospirillales bacterium]|nr:acyl-CoA thioesterase [Rhodospirillales bacterium]